MFFDFLVQSEVKKRIILVKFSPGAWVLFLLGVTFFKFYNRNLHNIAKSDRIGFKTKKPVVLTRTRARNSSLNLGVQDPRGVRL